MIIAYNPAKLPLTLVFFPDMHKFEGSTIQRSVFWVTEFMSTSLYCTIVFPNDGVYFSASRDEGSGDNKILTEDMLESINGSCIIA